MKKIKKWILWLIDIDDNFMNALNLIGLAITTYGVMYFLPKNNLKTSLAIASLGFVILGFFKLIVGVLSYKPKNI